MSRSKIIDILAKTAADLGVNTVTIREIEALNLKEVKPLSPRKIKRIRMSGKLSQAVMAKILNVTPSTYQKWERGEVTPRGANLKLLCLANDHGVEYILN